MFRRSAVFRPHRKTDTGGVVIDGQLPCEETGRDLVTETKDHLVPLLGTIFQVHLYTQKIEFDLIVSDRCSNKGTLSVRSDEQVGRIINTVGMSNYPVLFHSVIPAVNTVFYVRTGGNGLVGQLHIQVGTVDHKSIRHFLRCFDLRAVGQHHIGGCDGPVNLRTHPDVLQHGG